MISKAHRNNSFKATLGYLMGKDNAVILDSGNLWGNTLDQQTREMIIAASESKRAKKPVYHLSLSISPEDRGKLNDEKFRDIAGEYLEKLGLKDNQYIVVKHNDTDHEHIHIVVNRVRDGKAANLGNDYKKLVDFDREIEQKYGLIIAPKTLREEKELKQEKEFTLPETKNMAKEFVLPEHKATVEDLYKKVKDYNKSIQEENQRKKDFLTKLNIWRQNTLEVRQLARDIEKMKAKGVKISPKIWREMREKTYQRDRAAKMVLDDEYSKGLHPKRINLLKKHAQKALTKSVERKPHFVNHAYKWERENQTVSDIRSEINRGKEKDPKKVKDMILNMNDHVVKRNKNAYMLQSDKEQLGQLESAYREAIRNHALQYEKELQRQKQQEIQRGIELEQNRFPEPPKFN